jgi:hypothetical protein
MIKHLKGPLGFTLVLDSDQVFLDDPGNGTPVLVEGPKGISGTYFCTIATGECDGVDVPAAVMRWLEAREDMVNNFIDARLEELEEE